MILGPKPIVTQYFNEHEMLSYELPYDHWIYRGDASFITVTLRIKGNLNNSNSIMLIYIALSINHDVSPKTRVTCAVKCLPYSPVCSKPPLLMIQVTKIKKQ